MGLETCHASDFAEQEIYALNFPNRIQYSLFFMENVIRRNMGLHHWRVAEEEPVESVENKIDAKQKTVEQKKSGGNLKRKRFEAWDNVKIEASAGNLNSFAHGEFLHPADYNHERSYPSVDECSFLGQSPSRTTEKKKRRRPKVEATNVTVKKEFTDEPPVNIKFPEAEYKIKSVSYDNRLKLPWRVRIYHNKKVAFEDSFKTKEEAEKAVKCEFEKLNKSPWAVVKIKTETPTKREIFPKSNVMGVTYPHARNKEKRWLFALQKKRKKTLKSFKTREEAEEFAFAEFEKMGIKQGPTEVRGVYFDKKNLKRCWEARVLVGNVLVFRKHFETKEEAEEAAKFEFKSRGINWRKKRVSRK